MAKKSKVLPRVLVVDDETDLADLLELTLLKMGLDVVKANGVALAKTLLDSQRFDLCLSDMRMPDGEGLELVQHIQARKLDVPIAILTAYGSTNNAIAALKAGAFDYLAKPVALEQLRTLVKSALKLDTPESPASLPTGSNPLLGNSPALQYVLGLVDKLARNLAPVYITGESGSGKERAARLIHAKSARADKPFIAVNCGAIPENLMESEFFGYRKGAFTGANEDREGFFQAANGGTLFLDEVADLPLVMQVKLLRAIQERKVRQVGGVAEVDVDVRIISATHQNLSKCVEAGKFRQDLYYRLNVIELKMPPLREMGEDVLLIAQAVLQKIAARHGMRPPVLQAEALSALRTYDFPGNVRELENLLERALALCDGEQILAEDLHIQQTEADKAEAQAANLGDTYPLQDYLDRVERAAIMAALDKTNFNRTQAAKLLGITFRSMRYRLDRLGITQGADE
ncbi:sigma-54-dependent Fis family transcriptional regulator [Chitinibacter bivalviorum]|uniref:Sigma-54-dependent Fis family transcriptional regulator n=1 Tax=Chitinibacter bivalviorum TaxID=2739434 RepID=A0A7H9BM30_9NEIS|nr:sigma-54 dependent transcriptional regulator [Chitinibacter bivalviorum]QLG89529.1 sigma-54-dependent Fis family transcriptional regulator [Chitinibacter bivalviorum]